LSRDPGKQQGSFDGTPLALIAWSRTFRSYHIVASTIAPTQRLWIGLKSDPELYEWQDDIYAKCPLLGVSGPTNFVHQGEFDVIPYEWKLRYG
jgi:hypothetical protein